MAYSITITNNTSSAKMRFYAAEVPNTSYSLQKRKFEYQFPEGDAEDNIAIDLGEERIIRINFKFTNTTGTSESIDTTGSLYTTSQKLTYFDSFFTSGIQDNYLVEITSNNGNLSKTCTLEGFNIDFSNQNPLTLPGSISFKLGGGS